MELTRHRDFADEYPSAQVTGVDISPIQPSWLPPNCKFQIDDIDRPWGWPSDSFDFIHARHLEGCVSDWHHLYEQVFKHLKPGGYFEIKEFDIETRSQTLESKGQELDENHVYRRWVAVMLDALQRMGKPGSQTRDHGIADALASAGFVDITEHKWPVPIGNWPKDPKMKEVGACNLHYLDESLEGFSVFLLKRVMGWEDSEILCFIEEMRRALRLRKLAPYITLHLVYARKPGESG
ncbi:methyltransferase domain-containing protein [Colletotrichum truncatum]|uniref:Methyltransferase domain-containing protein n=1 Tax=Colletotrichum truncatum TaxID=5467 RepID=A0ACC3YJM3_COLTU